MSTKLPNYLSELPIYRKAVDIWVLSRSISTYLNYDLATLNAKGEEDPNIYFSGDIVQQSTSLGDEVINAALEPLQENRDKHFLSLSKLSKNLYDNCSRLEKVNSRNRDYLSLLKVELRKFNRLQRHWMMSL